MAKKSETATSIVTTRPPEPSVALMLQAIIEKGVTPENMTVMEAMVGLYERMQAKEAEREFNTAFLELKKEMPKIAATKPVPNNDGTTRYKYAPLDEIDEILQPLALRHGFTYTFAEGDKSDATKIEKVCTVYHTGGHKRSNSFACRKSAPPKSNDSQADGNTHSYAKRGALCDAFGIVVDRDDDARQTGATIGPIRGAALQVRVLACGANEKAFLKFAGATGDDYGSIPEDRLEPAEEMLRRKEAADAKAKEIASNEVRDAQTGEFQI